MDARGIHLLEAIGADGLRAAIRDSFDRSGLVQLGNACRVKFPGRRAVAVDDDRLRDALVKGFLEDETVRPVLMKALARANADLLSSLEAMDDHALHAWAAGLTPEDAGRALFALALDERPAAAAARETLLRRTPSGPAPPRGASREARLAEEVALLRERIEKLEASRSAQNAVMEAMKEREAAHQQEIVAARKDVHHLRKMIAQADAERARLREENQQMAGRLAGDGQAEDLSVRLHQLARDQRKIVHDLEELLRRPAASNDTSTRPYLDALAAGMESLRRDVADVRRHLEEDAQRAARALQDLSDETRMIRSDFAQWRRAIADPAPRRKGELERVGIFVDVQNMYYAARQLNARLDFGTLMSATTRGRRLIRAIAYVVQNRDIDQSGFLAMLQQKNYEVRRKDLKIRNDGSSKGDWDMEMALDILRLAESLDVVVLVSGDGDFASLVTQIKTLGPKVEVYSFPGSTAKELVEAADRHVPLDEGFLIRMSPSS